MIFDFSLHFLLATFCFRFWSTEPSLASLSLMSLFRAFNLWFSSRVPPNSPEAEANEFVPPPTPQSLCKTYKWSMCYCSRLFIHPRFVPGLYPPRRDAHSIQKKKQPLPPLKTSLLNTESCADTSPFPSGADQWASLFLRSLGSGREVAAFNDCGYVAFWHCALVFIRLRKLDDGDADLLSVFWTRNASFRDWSGQRPAVG